MIQELKLFDAAHMAGVQCEDLSVSCLIFPFIFSPSFVFFVVIVDGTDHEINRERRRGSFVFVFFVVVSMIRFVRPFTIFDSFDVVLRKVLGFT